LFISLALKAQQVLQRCWISMALEALWDGVDEHGPRSVHSTQE